MKRRNKERINKEKKELYYLIQKPWIDSWWKRTLRKTSLTFYHKFKPLFKKNAHVLIDWALSDYGMVSSQLWAPHPPPPTSTSGLYPPLYPPPGLKAALYYSSLSKSMHFRCHDTNSKTNIVYRKVEFNLH